MLVFVEAKKIREELITCSDAALRAGLDIAGAKARSLLAPIAAWLKPCPDTKPDCQHLNSPSDEADPRTLL